MLYLLYRSLFINWYTNYPSMYSSILMHYMPTIHYRQRKEKIFKLGHTQTRIYPKKWDAKSYQILFTNLSARAGYDTRSIFKRSLTGLNSKFSFSRTSCLTKAEEPSRFYYFTHSWGGRRIIGFIPFPRVLVLCEMQWASSRIWTRVAVSISYDDNHYTRYEQISESHIEESIIIENCMDLVRVFFLQSSLPNQR